MIGVGWLVLLLLFLVELAAWAAYGVWGWQAEPRWLLVWLLPLLVITVWFWFAAPRARYGGSITRPLVKVVVFGLAVLALYDAGRPAWALTLLVAAVVLNGLAQLPAIRNLAEQTRPDGAARGCTC